MESILTVIMFLVAAIGVIGLFIWWWIVRGQRIRSNDYRKQQQIHQREEKAGEARSLIERLQSLDWKQLLDLRQRHEVGRVADYTLGAYVPNHTCDHELQKLSQVKPCWLQVVDDEIRRRLYELLRAGDLKEVQTLAVSVLDLDEAWTAIGTTAEGVAWLKAGLDSTNGKHRARCHSTLYDGE